MTITKVLDGEELDRALALHAEGMPATWIAEDLNCRRGSLRRSGIPEDPDASAEWRSAWSAIRRSPTLYELHREFAPPRQYSN